MLKEKIFSAVFFGIAFCITYLITGSIILSGAVALIEPVINKFVFSYHNKVWNKYEIDEYFYILRTVYSERV